MNGGRGRTGPLEYGVAVRAAPGEASSGDRAAVAPRPDGALVAVVDGLGHGEHAATAATAATEVLTADPVGPPPDLLTRCHDALRRTRGAAVTVATVTTAGVVDWLAVGNVGGAVIAAGTAATTRLVTRGGVVGLRLPRLRATRVTLTDGDLLVVFTDGIRDAITYGLDPAGDPQELAEILLERHARGGDDALVLAARYRRGEQ